MKYIIHFLLGITFLTSNMSCGGRSEILNEPIDKPAKKKTVVKDTGVISIKKDAAIPLDGMTTDGGTYPSFDSFIIKDSFPNYNEAGSFIKDSSLSLDGFSLTPGFVLIPPGIFTMGAQSGNDPCAVSGSETVHQVTLTHFFEMSSREVNQNDFLNRLGFNPSLFPKCGGQCPVDNVTWHLAAAYCNQLSAIKGLNSCYQCKIDATKKAAICEVNQTYRQSTKSIYDCPGYRLPTEAEWEYAYRAGTKESSYAGMISSCTGKDSVAEKIGWYKTNSGNITHSGGQKAPNAWGLYDMAGNVSEWCNDYWQADLGINKVTNPQGVLYGASGVVRGGDYSQEPSNLRGSHRHSSNLDYSPGLGLRCARSF